MEKLQKLLEEATKLPFSIDAVKHAFQETGDHFLLGFTIQAEPTWNNIHQFIPLHDLTGGDNTNSKVSFLEQYIQYTKKHPSLLAK